MAVVANIELPWTQQPPPYTPLDEAAEINRDLLVVAYGGVCARLRGPVVEGLPVLTGQTPLTAGSGSPVIRPHRDGLGPVFSGGAQQYLAGLVGSDAGGTGPFTLEVLARITSAPSLAGFFTVLSGGDGSARGVLAFGGGSNKNIYFWGSAADLASGVDWLEDGSLQHVFIVSEGSGQAMRFYRGGAQIASGTTPTLSNIGSVSYAVGDFGNWASSPTGAIVKAAHYRRALTPGEVRLLTDDPWANFESLRLPISFTASAPSAPTLTAASAVNVTSTSFRPRVTFTR